MNANEIKSLLNGRAEDVCLLLLPGGKRKGNDWLVGSTGGEAGDSMRVHLAGDRVGSWKDFAGNDDDKGDLFSLWQKARGCDFVTALKQAKEWLGVADVKANGFHKPISTPKTFVRPKVDEVEPLLSGGDVFNYLTKDRQLDPAVVNRYRIGQLFNIKQGHAAVFPLYDPAAKAVDMMKFLAVERFNGKKMIWATADSRPRLFGWQAIPADAREVVISEGEIDAMTIAGWGFPCLSLPSGVANMEWIEQDYEALERFERIYLSTDMDQPGHKAAELISNRLGRERCFRITLPDFKDANEAHCSGRFLGPDFEDRVVAAKTLDPAELKNLGEMGDEIWETMYPSDRKHAGTEPPFNIDWRCRHGELSIWTGWSGHGKSHLINQFLVHDAHQGERICIASFEMPAGETGARLAQMILGFTPRSDERAKLAPAESMLGGKFWVVNHVGVMHWSKLMPILQYAARRYGCTRFAIDSLLRCGVAEDDYNGQKEFVSELVAFAAEYGHVHLVCHSRKGDDESKAPGKLDVRGAAAITDLTQNGFTVWRNKKKEQAIEEAKMTGRLGKADLYSSADAQISMWKNRKTGAEPFRKLWLHGPSGQFTESQTAKPFTYIQPPRENSSTLSVNT